MGARAAAPFLPRENIPLDDSPREVYIPRMTRRIRQELRQTKPFDSIEEEVVVEIQRTAQATMRWLVEELKPTGLTPSQFNVLRILRGARPEALSSRVICERMITYDPDLTRLLDRLEKAGWVEKVRDARDRRVVNIHITKTGVQTIEAATAAVRDRIRTEMKGIGSRKLGELADLLEQVRGNPA